MNLLHHRRLIVLISGGALAFGCAAPSKPPPPTKTATPAPVVTPGSPEHPAQLSNTDACAEQLHEASGALLLYYGVHHELPKSVDELKQLPGFENLSLSCPVSHLAYVYDPTLARPGLSSGYRLILYDAENSHAGMRWAVSVKEQEGNEPLVAKVVAVPGIQFPNRSK